MYWHVLAITGRWVGNGVPGVKMGGARTLTLNYIYNKPIL